MAVRRHKSHGKWVWQAGVAFRGRRTSVYRASYAEARTAERQLFEQFEAEAEREAQAAAAPATLRMLFEGYVADLAHRRKRADTIGRAVTTAKAVETLVPELLDQPVSRIGDRELYAFTRARAAKATPGTINRDFRTLRAMLKRARPATMALNAGFTAPIVMALGGWKSEAMTRRYAVMTDPTLRAAAEAISGTEPWHPIAKSASALTTAAPSQG